MPARFHLHAVSGYYNSAHLRNTLLLCFCRISAVTSMPEHKKTRFRISAFRRFPYLVFLFFICFIFDFPI